MELLQLPHGRTSVQLWFFWLCRITSIALLSGLFVTGAYGIAGNETDRLALLAIKAEISDPSGFLTSWNSTSVHFCRWSGVVCNGTHQRVIQLNLGSQKLSGTISPRVGDLSFLMILDLSNNSFSSSIPPEIGHLSRLRELYLHENFALSGLIPPSLGNLSSLVILRLGHNEFGGRIPNELGKLGNLEQLDIAFNNFTGTFPASIFNISSITTFDLSDNVLLTASLPPDIGFSLPNLRFLIMRNNGFGGLIPQSLSNASSLELLEISMTKMSGKFPSFLRMKELWKLTVGRNFFGTGQDGDLNFICSMVNTSLLILELGPNNFGGTIPECIGNLPTNLTRLLIIENPITGSIPSSIGNLINLQTLAVQFSNISGTIPPEVGHLTELKELYFNQNNISGYIPEFVGNLKQLTRLFLDNNNLEGPIPSTLGMCQSLQLLDLGGNKLSGTIPSEVMNLSSLSIYVDLSDNRLTGELPYEVGKLTTLGKLFIEKNNLSGGIPSSLGSCVSLEILYMQDNFFEGSIPSTLSSLNALQELNLSNNRLSGQIPEFLERLPLIELDLSFNEFEGPLPTKGIFSNASAISILGNNKLCGGLSEFQLTKCNIKEPNRKNSSRNVRNIIIYTIFGLLGVACLLALVHVFWFKKKNKKMVVLSSGNELVKVSYQSILKATDGFSSGSLMGVGSFGSVYRATFDGWTENPVAVKVLNLARYGASKSFIAECEALRNIRHRNLVKVLTACSGTDHQGNDFKALLYEFMANGNLDDWLHPSIDSNNEAPEKLDLMQRLNIALDVACALDYLHHQCETPIVHCDLKPSNVLLKEDMTAHIGDFGLVRFLPEATHKLLTDQTSSIGVKGSFGYIAPEYGAGGEVSTYGDVYSFGILILELFTGKRPTDGMFTNGLNLHNFVKAALPEHVSQIVDPAIALDDGNPVRTRCRKIQECFVSVMEIGVKCSSELPRERMNMTDVAADLQAIRNKLA